MAKMNIDTQTIAKLAAIMEDRDLSEIEIDLGEDSIRLARGHEPIYQQVAASAPVAAAPAAAPAASAAAAPVETASNVSAVSHPGCVKSPMVGTLYMAPQPGADPFIKTGDSVTEGQTVLIIEAMKVMNPIAAPRSGTVKEILVADGHPTEFDEPLLIIE